MHFALPDRAAGSGSHEAFGDSGPGAGPGGSTRVDSNLTSLRIAEAGRRIDDGSLSPSELTEAAFARIEATDGGERGVNAFVRLMRASAEAEASAAGDRAAAGNRLGPLDGIPVAVKDLFDTAGVVTNAGTSAFLDRVPARDATAVARLRDAGAVLLGKTTTHELAMGGTNNNYWHGPTRNPWHLDRVPGGSSGGSAAAIAAGQALGTLGTDAGGSIRIPAAFCGLTGHKPTYGLVGRGGVAPLSFTIDHAGPLAWTAEDCALLLNALQGPDPRDLDSVARAGEDFTAALGAGVEGLTLGVIPSLLEQTQDAVLENFEASLEVLRDLGATIVQVEPMQGEGEWRSLGPTIGLAELASGLEEIVRERPEAVSEPMRSQLLASLELPAIRLVRALQRRKLVEARFEAALDGIDAYLCPSSPQVAELIADDPQLVSERPDVKFRNTGVFDLTHQPSISVPNGSDADGLPTGLLISGALFADALVLRIAHAYQGVTDFHAQAPAL